MRRQANGTIPVTAHQNKAGVYRQRMAALRGGCSPVMHRLFALVAALALGASAVAEPAPWYQWHSRIDGAVVCAQASPGQGWIRSNGPFRNAQVLGRLNR